MKRGGSNIKQGNIKQSFLCTILSRQKYDNYHTIIHIIQFQNTNNCCCLKSTAQAASPLNYYT